MSQWGRFRLTKLFVITAIGDWLPTRIGNQAWKVQVMGIDAQGIAIGVMAAVQLAMFAYIFYAPILKARIFKCPVCEKKVSREHITLTSLDCPHCEWRLVPAEQTEEANSPAHLAPLAEDAVCSKCNGLLTNVEYVELWNNWIYCKECVTQRSPALWEYAFENETISEGTPHTGGKIFKRMFLFLDLGILALFGSIAFFAGFGEGGIATAFLYLFWCQVIILPFILVFTAASTGGYIMHRPEVSLFNNRVTVRQGTMNSLTKPLDEFEWFLGDASKTNLNEKIIMPGGPAVLLVLPREKSEPEQYVAVGYDDRMRDIWTAFLSLSGIERRSDWERKTSKWYGVVNLLFAILLFPVGFGICFGLSMLLSLAIESLTGDRGLARLLGVQPLMPGTIFFIAYAAVLWPSGGFSGGRTKNSDEGRLKTERKVFWAMFGMCLFIVSAMMFPHQGIQATTIDRIIAASMSITVWFFVSRDYAKRVAERT